MTAQLSPSPVFQAFAPGGGFLAGGLLFTFAAGTSTPQATYTDFTKSTLNANPVVLNSTGQANIWLDPSQSYKFALEDHLGTPIWTVDNIQGALTANVGPLIPSVDNAFTLGNTSFSWENVYVGPNHAAILDVTSGNVGYYAITPLEVAASVTPSNFSYPPGNPRRYGALGTGWAHDDTAAMAACIKCNTIVRFQPGDTYGVTTITFPSGAPSVIDFNGAVIIGIATMPTTAVVVIQSNFANFYNYSVQCVGDGHSVATPNPNYTCATWWYNAAAATQFNTFFGCTHANCERAMIYGQLPGNPSTTIVQSENSIYGWKTVGVSNPFFMNSSSGFIHFGAPIFFRDVSGWTTPTMPSTGRALEIIVGALFVMGGEMVFSNSTVGLGADLAAGTFVNMYWEGAPPVNVLGSVSIIGGNYLNTQSNTSAFKIASGSTGQLQLFNTLIGRETGAGLSSAQPMIDSTAAPDFQILLNDTTSSEWKWQLVFSNVRLVEGGQVRYHNHRMSITATDPNTYVLTTNPTPSLLSDTQVDHLGYTATGWTLVVSFGAGTTLQNTTVAGPTGYLASQLSLVATGAATALSGNPTNISTIQGSMLRVTPTDLFWVSAWIQIATGGSQAVLSANFYSLIGALVSQVGIANQASIVTGVWTYVEGPATVPAGSAYMAIGISGTTSTVRFTDVRVGRAN